MASNIPPADISHTAMENLAAAAESDEKRFIAAKNTVTADAAKLAKAGASALSLIPDLIKLIEKGLPPLIRDVEHFDFGQISNLLTFVWNRESQYYGNLAKGPVDLIKNIDKKAGTEFIKWFLEESLGVELSAEGVDATTATDTISDLSGFLLELPLIAAGITAGGKLLLGERFGDMLGEYVTKFTEELGLNWLVGGLLEKIFEQAVGQELEELINVQKLPSRADFGTLRTLLRQHKLDEKDYRKNLRLLGFPPSEIDLLLKLDTSQLPVTDIQAARQLGYKDDVWFAKYLEHLGYSDDDVDILKYVYLNHLNTQAHSQLAATARRLFTEDAISESQFRTILATANTPSASVDIEVENINLEKTYGRLNLAKTDIKKLFDDGTFAQSDVIAELKRLGYNDTDANNIYAIWNDKHNQKPKSIPAAKIIQFMVSGVLTPQEAYDKITALGYKAEDASLLVQNPTTGAGHHPFELKPASVLQAYIEGLITVDTVMYKLNQLNVTTDAANYMILNANYKIANKKHKPVTPKSIGQGDIHEAFTLGIINEITAETMLEEIGFNPADAHFVAWNWYIKLNPWALGSGGFPFPPIPGTIIPPGTGGVTGTTTTYTPELLLINFHYYRVYDTATNPTAPPNSKVYAAPDGHIYYILDVDTVPPNWVYQSGYTSGTGTPSGITGTGNLPPPNPTG